MLRQNLLLLISATIASILLAEVLLRLVLPAPIMQKVPQEFYDYDSVIGHQLRPGQSSFTHDKPVITNAAGCRDREYPASSGDGVYRILALGDSQTFGNGLDLADTWVKQLEARFNRQSTGWRIEVMNCGLPASDTWQHEVLMPRLLDQYDFNAVILALYVNDVVRRPNRIPLRVNKFSNTASSRAAYVLKRSVLLLTLRSAAETLRLKLKPDREYLEQLALLRGETDADIEGRWAQVNRSLGKMKQLAANRQIPFLLVSLPRRDQVSGILPAAVYSEKLGVITANHGIKLIETLGPLQQGYREIGQELFISWDGHNNVAANRIIAHEIAGSFTPDMQ